MKENDYESFLFRQLMDAEEEITYLKKIIKALREQELYTRSIENDYDENSYESYEMFDLEAFIEDQNKKGDNYGIFQKENRRRPRK